MTDIQLTPTVTFTDQDGVVTTVASVVTGLDHNGTTRYVARFPMYTLEDFKQGRTDTDFIPAGGALRLSFSKEMGS